MAKIRDGCKWGCWIPPMGMFLSLFAVITAQQPGFLSISCGGTENHTNLENNITWVTDVDYIDVGETADIGNASKYGSYLHTLRFFPKPLNKSCYQLPVTPDVPYLLRLWFAVGNYSRFQTLPSFQISIETLGLLFSNNIYITYRDASYYEYISVSSGRVLYVCFIRTSERDDPFISAIEMRTLQDGMYGQLKPGIISHGVEFYNIGGNSVVRYPQDKFDRIYGLHDSPLNSVLSVSTEEVISTNNTRDLPPTALMQTAWLANNSDIIRLSYVKQRSQGLLLLYFAEIETVNMSESRSFYIQINGGTPSKTINLLQNYSAVELTLLPNNIVYFDVVKAPNSFRPPILNAYEYHWLSATHEATYSQDIDALDAIKRSFNIKGWVSDPCYFIQWDGIGCDRSSSPIRISEINLSGRNLTGSVPNDIGNLTALVNL